MKKIYLLVFSTLASAAMLKAQNPCSTGRYSTNTFSAAVVTSSVTYGSNTKAFGGTQILTMDIYQPAGDVETSRPLIIWAHGGSFQAGSSTDGDVTALSQDFAKKGFVCASINYRLGFFPLDSTNAIKAVLRAVQDMKASIRFFYKDKLTTNTYKIDTNNIFIGGSSAGAITALQTQYLDKQCELNYYLTDAVITSMGGMNGASGNPGYSTKVNGVINLCGALGRYSWIEQGDLPFCSMHGTNDGTVLYNRGQVNPGVPLIVLDGSRVLKEQANALGINNPFYTWYGKDHVPYSGSTLYMDTTINFVRDYLVSRLGCTSAPLLAQNAPAQVAVLYAYTTACSAVGIKENESANQLQSVYPNPSADVVKLVFVNQNLKHSIEVTDISGKVLKTDNTDKAEYTLEKNSIAPGIYFVKVSNSQGQSSTHKVIFY